MLTKEGETRHPSLGRWTFSTKDLSQARGLVRHRHICSHNLSRRRFIQASGTAAGLLMLSPRFSLPARAS
jgi:hypothetical protein